MKRPVWSAFCPVISQCQTSWGVKFLHLRCQCLWKLQKILGESSEECVAHALGAVWGSWGFASLFLLVPERWFTDQSQGVSCLASWVTAQPPKHDREACCFTSCLSRWFHLISRFSSPGCVWLFESQMPRTSGLEDHGVQMLSLLKCKTWDAQRDEPAQRHPEDVRERNLGDTWSIMLLLW